MLHDFPEFRLDEGQGVLNLLPFFGLLLFVIQCGLLPFSKFLTLFLGENSGPCLYFLLVWKWRVKLTSLDY